MENQLLLDGFTVPVHMDDDLQKHIPVHQLAMQQTGDPHGTIKVHIKAHMNALEMKQQAAMQQQMMMQQQAQGPGGGGSRGPKAGATPGMPRGGQNPPGAIHNDRMQDPSRVPR